MQERNEKPMIDTHVHFWKFDPVRDGWISEDMEVLQRDYLPEDIERICNRYGIAGVIAVQAAQTEAETEFLCSLAAENAIIKGVVGWTDLKSAHLPEKLKEYSGNDMVKGFRHILQGEDDGYMLSPDFIRGIKALKAFGFTYDILVYHYQLREVVKFLEKVPNQRFILDHCAKPPVSTGEIKTWAENMKEVSEHPEVTCKISGLVTEAAWHKWEEEDLYPYLDVVMDCFGAERVVYGSDWPVIYTSAFYGKWLHVLQEYMAQFTGEEQKAFFGGNARRFYGLEN